MKGLILLFVVTAFSPVLSQLAPSPHKRQKEAPPPPPPPPPPPHKKQNGPVPMSMIPAIQECPVGFIMAGSGCVKTTRLAPDIRCPKKSEPNGNSCLMTETFSAQQICPSDFSAKGKKCTKVVAVPAEMTCKNGGYTVVGQECVRKSNSDVLYKCPKGYTQDGPNCVQTTKREQIYVCPEGYEPYKKSQCVSYEVYPEDRKCPNGFFIQEGECVKIVANKPIYDCPKGYKLEDGLQGSRCMKYVKIDAEPVCSRGSRGSDGEGNRCVYEKFSAPTIECPKNYVLDRSYGEKCVKILEESPRMECKHGYSLEGAQCVMTTKFKADYICPDNSIMVKGKCEFVNIEEPILSCSKGWQSFNGECIRESVKPISVKCPKGYKSDEGDASCRRVSTVRAEEICEKGDKKGNECIYVESLQGELRCPEGILNADGYCVVVLRSQLQYNCPKGFRMDNTGQCSRSISVEPEYVCPPGSTQKKKKCEKPVAFPPSISCPKNYQIHPSGRCTQVITVEPLLECKHSGKLINGKCIQEQNHQSKKH